jgi:hypothetical protein
MGMVVINISSTYNLRYIFGLHKPLLYDPVEINSTLGSVDIFIYKLACYLSIMQT